MGTTGRVVQVSVSAGGVPKLPVEHARVTRSGLAGDQQHDLRHHGGPDRAVCLWSAEVISALRREGHGVHPGSAGENLTIEAIAWDLVGPGVRLAIGDELVVEIVSFTPPCSKIAASFADGDIKRVDQNRHPGASRVYARVEAEGVVRRGDTVQMLGCPSGTGIV